MTKYYNPIKSLPIQSGVPSGWTQIGGSFTTVVNSDSSVPSVTDRVLTSTSNTASGWLAWTALGTSIGDSEVLTLIKWTTALYDVIAITGASHLDSNGNAYAGAINDDRNLSYRQLEPGGYYSGWYNFSHSAIELTTTSWNWFRFRVQNGVLYLKTWPYGGSEPANWMQTETKSDLNTYGGVPIWTSGRIGLRQTINYLPQCAYISAADGGDTAPWFTDAIPLANAASLTNGNPVLGAPVFTNNLPTVTGVTANKGSVNGGTNVVISGTNFNGSPTVKFGGASATNVSVIDSTSIACTTPAHAGGVVDIEVTTVGGTATGTGLFTYIYVFDAVAFVPSGPVLGSPLVEGFIWASNLSSGSPILPTIVLGVKRVLTAANLSSGHPTWGAPLFMKVLPIAGLTNGHPVLGPATIHQTHPLSCSGLVNSSPVLGVPAFGQKHVVATGTLSSGQPSWNTAAFYVGYFFEPVGLPGVAPVIPTIPLSIEYILSAVGITASPPVIGAGVIKQALTPQLVLSSGHPVLDAPTVIYNVHLHAAPLTNRLGVTSAPEFTASPIDPIVVHNTHRYDRRAVSLMTNWNDAQEIDVAPKSLIGRYDMKGGVAQKILLDPEVFDLRDDGVLTVHLNAGWMTMLFSMMNADKHLVGSGLKSGAPIFGAPELTIGS